MFKTKFDQLTNLLTEHNTRTYLQDKFKVITLRSGKQVEQSKQVEVKPRQEEVAENGGVQTKEAKSNRVTNMHEANNRITKSSMHYPSNLWSNPYMEKRSEEVEPLKTKEKYEAKKASREFESQPNPSKYALFLSLNVLKS